jgi:hypothetical protein
MWLSGAALHFASFVLECPKQRPERPAETRLIDVLQLTVAPMVDHGNEKARLA